MIVQDMIPIEEAKKQLWKAVDLLRGSMVLDDYYVVLYLFTLRKEGLLSKDHVENWSEPIHSRLRSIEDERKRDLLIEVTKQFDEVLDNMDGVQINGIIDCLDSIDGVVYTNHFEEVFDFLLYELAKSRGRFGGVSILPQEVAKFISELARPRIGAKIYNPFAGMGSFIQYHQGTYNFFADELNVKTWAVGALRLLTSFNYLHTKYRLGDSIHEWNSWNLKYDLIVSNPPLGMKLPEAFEGRFGTTRNVESFLIEKGLEDITSTGKLVVVLTNSFLSKELRRGDKKNSELAIREYLVEEDLLEKVISLPGGLLFNTGIPVTVLVINKGERTTQTIQMVDASDYIDKTSKQPTLRNYELARLVLGNQSDDAVKFVSKQDIRDNDYNLTVPRYFRKEIEGVRLEDIVEPCRGSRVESGAVGKFVRIRDLSKDQFNTELNLDLIEEAELPVGTREISESAILLSTRWQTLKVAHFKYSGESIYLRSDIVAVKVSSNEVSADFLASELLSDYVQEQYQLLVSGNTVQFINKKDLLSIKVQLPTSEEQLAKLKALEELSSKLQALEEEKEAIKQGEVKKSYDEFASLKHTLGTPRQNILSYSEVLISFFKNNDSDALDNVRRAFKKSLGQELDQVFEAIRSDINYISVLLEKGENGLILEDYELKPISIREIEKFVKGLKANNYNFKLEVRVLSEYDKEVRESEVNADMTLFKSLLDNVLNNADKHGFDSDSKENEVIIDLSIINQKLVIDIKNNGKPFPPRFNKEKFIAKYSTASPTDGSGLGGYDINRIVEYFGAEWDLILNEDKVYPVEFKFELPIIFVS